MALMFAIWRPQPNWIPRNPKLMFQICQKASLGLSMWDPPFARILPHGIHRRSEDFRGVAIGEAESAGECAIGRVASHVDAARGIQPVPLDQDHAEPRQWLSAPAHGRAFAVWAPGVLDLETEQFVRPCEDGLDLVRAHRLARHLRVPRDTAEPPSFVALSGEPLARTGHESHVVGRERRARASAAGTHDSVVPEHDRASLVVGARLTHERDD